MKKNLMKAAAAAGALMVGLSACTAPGTAAMVGKMKVTEKQVDALAAAIEYSGAVVPSRRDVVVIAAFSAALHDDVEELTEGVDASLKEQAIQQCAGAYQFISVDVAKVPAEAQDYCFIQTFARSNEEFAAKASEAITSIDYSERYGKVEGNKLSFGEFIEMPEGNSSN